MRRGCRSWAWLVERGLRGDLINAYKYLKGGLRGWCQILFSGAQGQDEEHKLKHRKFHLNMRNNFFPLKVSEHWDRLSKEMVKSLWIHLNAFLCHCSR